MRVVVGIDSSGFVALLLLLGDFADHHRVDQLFWSILCVSVELELAVDPDRQFFQGHSFLEIVVDHIGYYSCYFLSVVLSDHDDSFLQNFMIDLVSFEIVALAAGQQCGYFKHDHAKGENIAFFEDIFIFDIFFSQFESDEELGGGVALKIKF